MDDPFSSGAAIAVRKNGLEGPTRHVAVVSNISNQPQVRLQMEATLRRGREGGAAGSVPSSWAIAWSNESDMVEENSQDAAAASKLGQSEAASSTGPGTPQATRSVGAHDWSMAQEDETEWPSPATFPPRAVDEFGEVERGESQQPGMDRRFQRVVSNARRAAGGTVDGAGPVQSLSADHPIVAGSKVGGGTASFPGLVRALRLSRDHSGRQRRTVWIDRPGGAFAVERVVDGLGDLRGIHRSRPPRTEWRARANASSDESRNHSATFAQWAGTATPDGSVGPCLQSGSSPRSAGAADASRTLPSSSLAPQGGKPDVSRGMGCATGPEQWADQVARTQALRGGSLCRISSGTQTRQEEMVDLFRPRPGWRAVGTRCGRNAPSPIHSSPMTSLTLSVPTHREPSQPKKLSGERTSPAALRAVPLRGECYRTHRCAPPPAGRSSAGGKQGSRGRKCYPCPGLKCYPCPGPPPTSALSPLRGEGGAWGQWGRWRFHGERGLMVQRACKR